MAIEVGSFWKELIEDDNYKLKIIDIGAADMEDGSPSYKILIDLGITDIIGFEPNQEACEALNKKMKKALYTYLILLVMGQVQLFMKPIGRQLVLCILQIRSY